MEYDVNSDSANIEVSAKVGIKLFDFISLDIAGKYVIALPFQDKDCGTNSLMYFENPENRIYLQNYDSYIEISESL